MTLTSISCIKNDSDIIETFVRVNSAFIDIFLFIDDSSDGTTDILKCLAQEGFKIIRLYRDKSKPFRQDLIVTSALHFVIDQRIDGDYFILLDSDEFPKYFGTSHALQSLNSIPQNCFGAFQWETYVPETIDFDKKTRNGLQSSFRQRVPEGNIFEKVIIPRALAKDVYITVGSHSANRLTRQPLGKYVVGEKLAHFPVRSPQQIINKNISAVYGLMRKESRLKGEGYHVYDVLKKLVDNNFELSIDTLREIAIKYANESHASSQTGVAPNWISPYELRYTQQSHMITVNNICNILLESWLSPFAQDQVFDLKQILQRK